MPPRSERTLRPLQEQAEGQAKRAGGEGESEPEPKRRRRVRQRKSAARCVEQQDGRRPGSARPTTGDEASDDDDDRGGSEMDISVRGVGRGGRTRRERWLCG